MAEDPAQPDPAVSEEDLVAYLDGEVDEKTGRRIEELLASDPRVRQTLQQLERTWELLDKLEAERVDENFTRSTLEVVVVAAADDVRRREAELPRRRRWQWFLGVSGVLAAGVAGFLAVALGQSDPDRQLLADLPLLVNLNQYRQVGDFEFLKMLDDEGLFAEQGAEEGDEEPTGSLPAHSRPAQRRRWIEDLGAAGKAELVQAREWLSALNPDEQERLRRLSRQVEKDPDGEELLEVMRRYHQWFTKLPLYRRAEVTELPPAERIAQIKKMQQEEEQRALRQPSPRDAQGLFEWMEQYAARHEAEILKSLPKDRREEATKASPEHRRRLVTSILWTRWGSGKRGGLPVPTQRDLEEVRSRLSPETRQRLESKSSEKQWRMIGSWARYMAHYQGDLKRGGAPFPEPGDAELVHFFEYELTNEQRDTLLGLPADEMQRQLRRMYFRIKLPRPQFRLLEASEPAPVRPAAPPRAEESKPRKPLKPAAEKPRAKK